MAYRRKIAAKTPESQAGNNIGTSANVTGSGSDAADAKASMGAMDVIATVAVAVLAQLEAHNGPLRAIVLTVRTNLQVAMPMTNQMPF